MTNKQSDALRVAVLLEVHYGVGDKCLEQQAAAELRLLHDLLGKANALCRIRSNENARLHALNQELLESLHECLGAVEGLEAQAKIWSGIANKARAAIAKATGEQP